MSPATVELMTPRILVVDDERQIHASLRLRLGRDYDLVHCLDARDALEKLSQERFDLCFADIHMPHMDGLTFIDAARERDPGLGYVVLSAFDTDENLRRAIPLQVYDFIPKPLPEKHGFEGRIPGWVGQTRGRRRERDLAQQAQAIAVDRDSARLERDVEFVASETARDALLQTASLLTTIHAQLVGAATLLAARPKTDPGVTQLARILEEGRKTADAAMTAAEGFFDSAYGSRDSSPALINEGIRHALGIATRMTRADSANKAIDFRAFNDRLAVRGLSGIEFLLMLVPALGVALASAPANTTVGIHSEYFSRLEFVLKDPRLRDYAWVNRRNATGSQAGALISISASAPALTRGEIDAWLRGEHAPFAAITPRGLTAGIQKSRGLLGLSLAPRADQFRLILALPT
jgi:CheY-like chemotaxis protein